MSPRRNDKEKVVEISEKLSQSGAESRPEVSGKQPQVPIVSSCRKKVRFLFGGPAELVRKILVSVSKVAFLLVDWFCVCVLYFVVLFRRFRLSLCAWDAFGRRGQNGGTPPEPEPGVLEASERNGFTVAVCLAE